MTLTALDIEFAAAFDLAQARENERSAYAAYEHAQSYWDLGILTRVHGIEEGLAQIRSARDRWSTAHYALARAEEVTL